VCGRKYTETVLVALEVLLVALKHMAVLNNTKLLLVYACVVGIAF
jgi:hypothetical protein